MHLCVQHNQLNILFRKTDLIILIALLIGFTATGQDYLKSGTISKQYNSMLEKAETYKQYKVIPRTDLKKFKNNILDSLGKSKAEYLRTQSTVNTQQTEIEQLKSELSSTQDELQQTTNEKSSINFLGVNMSKLKYKGLMWTLLGLTFSALLFFIYRFRNSSMATHGIRKQLSETQLAFDAYKKRALDKEQKISRMLQDEINKSNKSR